jgi:chromatin segregation and condensation protein Rec8/ScpA/Scc1 (kleisin family)
VDVIARVTPLGHSRTDDVFLAKSGVWWAVHPYHINRVFSLRTRNEVKARAQYAEILANVAAWKKLNVPQA